MLSKSAGGDTVGVRVPLPAPGIKGMRQQPPSARDVLEQDNLRAFETVSASQNTTLRPCPLKGHRSSAPALFE